MDKKVKLNKYTCRRIFDDATYLENQVNHVYRMYTGSEKAFVDTLSYDFKSIEVYEPIASQLSELWFITFEGDAETPFSYSSKEEIEERFGSTLSTDALPNGKPWLKTIQIELTDACNERCVHCYLPNKKKDAANFLSVGQVKGILSQFRENNGVKVIFSGGEILLYRQLKEILDYCKELELMILLQTNLLLFHQEDIEYFRSLELFNVQVSLYSVYADEHDSITSVKNSWIRTKRNIELFVRNNIPLMISCPIMRHNSKTIREIKEYADSLGVDCYFDAIMMAQTGGNTSNLDVRISECESDEVLRTLIETRPDYMDAIASSKDMNELLTKRFARRMSTCRIMDSGVCVDSDGTIYPCPGWNQMSLGNIDKDSLRDIWDSSRMTEYLRGLVPAEFKKCVKCNLKNFCDMCPVYNYNENGTIDTPVSIFCVRASKLRSVIIDIFEECHKKNN